MKKTLLASVVLTVFAAPAFCATLERLVGPERAALLASAGPAGQGRPLSEVQSRNPSVRLAPNHEGVRRFVAEAKADLGPGILVESLFLYRKPHGRSAPWSEAERAGVFNSVVALSTLAGLQYFSITRNSMRTFYDFSRVIDNPGNRAPMPDPWFSRPPQTLSLYARQRDSTFGDNVYRFTYRAGADYVLFMQENLTPMTAGIVPAIGRNRFRMVMAVIDAGDSLLIYAAAMARATPAPGMGDRIGASFNNRLDAVLQWFSGHANGVFR